MVKTGNSLDHGMVHIGSHNATEPDLTVTKQFFPEEGIIQIHQLHVCPCRQLPVGFYWYGGTRHSAGGVPRWVEKLTQNDTLCKEPTEDRQVETKIDDVAQGEDEPILIPNELENGDLTCLGDSNDNLQHDQGNGKTVTLLAGLMGWIVMMLMLITKQI